MTLPLFPKPPHPYARRHLAEHAAAAGKLHDVLNLETLPYLDEARLSILFRLTLPAPLSQEWRLLSAWLSIRHRWSWDDPDGNAAALDVAQLAVDPRAKLPDRRTTSGLAWRPRLVEWQSGGIIVAGEQHRGQHVVLAIGTVRGTPLLVTADMRSVRLWDPATGQQYGEGLIAPAEIRAVALAEGPGLVLAACEGGQVVTWDAITHVPAGSIETADPRPAAMAVGAIEDRWVVAVGGLSGVVQVRWILGGELVSEVSDEMPARSLALANTADGRLYLAIGYTLVDSGRISIQTPLSEKPFFHDGIEVDGEVTAVALAALSPRSPRVGQTETELVVAVGTARGEAVVWDALSGSFLASMDHGGEVGSLAMTTVSPMHLLATGGTNRTVQIWDALGGGAAGPPLQHPAAVTTVAFGNIEARTMVVTGCLDGNVRLWDPLRSSASRVSVDGWFPTIAMDADVIAAGGEDGQLQLWNAASSARYPPLPVEPRYRGLLEKYLPRVRRLRLGGSHARTLVSQDNDRVTVWDLTDPSSPALLTEAFRLYLGSDVYAVAESGQALMAGIDDKERVSVTDLLADTTLFAKRIDGADSVLFIDAPGRPLLGVGTGDKLHVLDIESGRRMRPPLPAKLPPHAAVGCLDGTDVLAVLDSDGLRLFDLETGKQTIPPVEMRTTAKGVAWGRVDDRDVLVTAHFATVRVWNPRTGRKITELRVGTRIGAISLRNASKGRLMIALSGPGLVLTELRDTSYNSF